MTFRHLYNVRGFFSDYYLGTIFGRGEGRGRRRRLSDRDSQSAYERFRRIRERAEGRVPDAQSYRERFLRPLFRDVLGFHLGEGADRVHSLFANAEHEAAAETPLAVLYAGACDEDLDGHAQARRRVENALAHLDLRYGFLASAERIRLVRPAGEGPRGGYLEVDLAGLDEDEDPESFAAFLLLCSSRAFVRAADGETPIEHIERESRKHAEKVSDDLKRAVFTAAESLVAGLIDDAVARERIRSALELPEDELRRYRDAALLALYRILFILYAESRDPRLDDHRPYREAYSIHALVEQLLRDCGRQWPENRSTLWARLRAVFRIYDKGLPPIARWEHIPPRGGDFFSVDTPEGRVLDTARLADDIVARLLLDLATTTPRRGVGRERVSFRELDIESLGSVYEGLLEFEPRIARETTMEVRVQGRTFALSPLDLVRLCEEKALVLKGDFPIVAATVAEALHPEYEPEEESDDTAGESDEESEELDETEDGSKEGEEEEDEGRAIGKDTTARLIRRLDPGRFHFVPGSARKGSSSFYTPRALVRDLVRHAIGPLVEGKRAPEIERLRILDPACGSGHFLVEAIRFLGQGLHRAYVEEYGRQGPPSFRSTIGTGWDEDWKTSDEEARASNSEARAWCKRRVAERCLFGVDRNPTAVELARVALWIESLAGDRPLTYFRHHIRPGNSLLGSWIARLDRPPLPDMASSDERQIGLFEQHVRAVVTEAAGIRRLIDEADRDALAHEGIEPESVREQEFKERQRQTAERLLDDAKLVFSLRAASAFIPEIWAEWPVICALVDSAGSLRRYAERREWWPEYLKLNDTERLFHWELEFPEVFVDVGRPGFDAVIGNPPWDKVLPSKLDFYGRHDVLVRAYRGKELARRIEELHEANPRLGDEFDAYRERTTIAAHVLRQGGDFPLSEARSQAAHEDVSKYFVDRAARLVADDGRVGFVVPSVLYNGDGCVGIRRFLLNHASIERFYGFENRRKIFPIDSREKFVSLTFRKGQPGTEAFDAAFMRRELEELEGESGKSWMVRMSREEIERLSPDTFAFLEYRSARDQELVRRTSEGRPTFGDHGPGGWGVRLLSWRAHEAIFNASEDRDLWTDPGAARLHSPQSVLASMPGDFDELVAAMRERGLWPVFEGKHVEQFLVGIKPVRWWLSVEQAEKKYGKPPRREATLVFRETASNTNERTCIAAVLPAESAASHKLTGVIVECVAADGAMVVLNSLCFDYLLRFRTAGTNISFTYIRPVAVPLADTVYSLPHVDTRLAWRSGLTHITEDRNAWPDLWAVNRAVAEAYGLEPPDFAHILDSFTVLARKRPAFVAYLRARLSEWAEEAGLAPVTAATN